MRLFLSSTIFLDFVDRNRRRPHASFGVNSKSANALLLEKVTKITKKKGEKECKIKLEKESQKRLKGEHYANSINSQRKGVPNTQ